LYTKKLEGPWDLLRYGGERRGVRCGERGGGEERGVDEERRGERRRVEREVESVERGGEHRERRRVESREHWQLFIS
jgi:hypothetical protein